MHAPAEPVRKLVWQSDARPATSLAWIELARKAAEREPDRADLWQLAGEAMVSAGRIEAGRAWLSDALARFPDSLPLRITLADVESDSEDFEAALATLRGDPRTREDPRGAAIELRMASYLGRAADVAELVPVVERLAPANHTLVSLQLGSLGASPRRLLEICDRALAIEPSHANAGYGRVRALVGLGRIDEAREAAGLDRFVAVDALEVGWDGDAAPFDATLRAEILANDTLRADPRGKATRSGLQTQRLVRPGNLATPALLAAIRARIDDYVAALEGDHGFVRGCPAKVRLHAWAVVYHDGGTQRPHRHPGAWLSGVYYVGGGSGGTEPLGGALLLGEDDQLGDALGPARRVEPVPGRIVLFPSSTMHATEPAPPGAERIAVAFDVIAATS